MNRSLLEKPFERSEIKQRKGNSGRMLDYVEGHSIIQRLNDSFDAEWSFTILKHDIIKETDEVFVLGELKAGNIVKSQFGSSKITRVKETGEIVSLASDFKAAATDALKKTSTMFGIALSLYKNSNGSSTNNENRNRQKVPSHPAGKSTEPQQPDNGNGDSHQPEGVRGTIETSFQPVDKSENVYRPQFKAVKGEAPEQGNDNGRKQMTQRQFEYIRSMGRKLGFDLAALSQKSTEIFNRELSYLNTKEASNFIDHMHAGHFRSKQSAV